MTILKKMAIPVKIEHYGQLFNLDQSFAACVANPTITEIDAGSTINCHRRKAQHQECYSNAYSKRHEYPVYTFIRANGGWDNWDMVQVAQVNANEKQQLRRMPVCSRPWCCARYIGQNEPIWTLRLSVSVV